MNKLKCLLAILLALPLLLFVYQPAMQLGGLGLLLGIVGQTLSVLLLIYLLVYYIRREWR